MEGCQIVCPVKGSRTHSLRVREKKEKNYKFENDERKTKKFNDSIEIYEFKFEDDTHSPAATFERDVSHHFS